MTPDAFELAVEALGRKERTSAELAEWLAARDVPADEVEVAIERLIELGELDDERFARRYAEDKQELAGWGPERIEAALLARGIEPALVEAVLAADTEDTQVSRAQGLLERRGDPPGSDAERARALGYLTRRGYSYEVAYEAVHRAGRSRM